ncbi:MAG: nucleotidyltransferase domain-containing protein [Gammaproteobacteria bacterium]|nr:nucleotidyltransferase domain-containing protein [Gammaproteobacteria bacterium]
MIAGLKDIHHIDISNVFRANKRVERAVLFGSRAKGDYSVASDVDIALFGEDLTITDHLKLAKAMEELSVPQKVDLCLFQDIQEKPLCESILRDGVEIYNRSGNETEKFLGILEKHRRILVSLIHKHIPGVEVWIADGPDREVGDDCCFLNLVLRGPEFQPISSHSLLGLENALLICSIPLIIKIWDWARISEHQRQKAVQNHSVLIEGEQY